MYKDEQAASPFDTNGTTMLSFILVLVAQVYAIYLLERIQPIPNTRYLVITKIVCQILGVVAFGILLSILLPPIWWWIIISPCAFKSIYKGIAWLISPDLWVAPRYIPADFWVAPWHISSSIQQTTWRIPMDLQYNSASRPSSI